MDGQEEEKQYIKLDGSVGLETRIFMTLITKDDVEGEKEETFEVPLAVLDQKNLMASFTLGLIKGFKVVRKDVRVGE